MGFPPPQPFPFSFTQGTFFSFLSVYMCASVPFFIIFSYHLSMFSGESIQSSIQLLFPFLQADTSLMLITNTLLINNLPPELQPFLFVLCHEMLKERNGGGENLFLLLFFQSLGRTPTPSFLAIGLW